MDVLRGDAVRRMLADDSGAVFVEYALVLSVFSMVSASLLVTFSSAAALAVRSSVTAMQSYGANPNAFECSLGTGSSC